MIKKISTIILVFFASFLVSYLIAGSFPRNSIKVSNQPKGPSINIQSVSLAKDGFVAALTWNSDERLETDLAYSEYLPAGKYENFSIFISEHQVIIVPDVLYIAIFSDDGDGIFNIDQDQIVKFKTVDFY